MLYGQHIKTIKEKIKGVFSDYFKEVIYGGIDGTVTTFIYSSIGTFLALVALGLMRWRMVGSKLMDSLFEVVAIGGTAVVLAYVVGTFFSSVV
ncbi:MAG: hypothetical protein LR008_01495 [Candidatus Pacebacteria bacterium]|nr:hypothetical protein [Candidatus Paceibacterota bacterium]